MCGNGVLTFINFESATVKFDIEIRGITHSCGYGNGFNGRFFWHTPTGPTCNGERYDCASIKCLILGAKNIYDLWNEMQSQ